jgi:hypothetical protein
VHNPALRTRLDFIRLLTGATSVSKRVRFMNLRWAPSQDAVRIRFDAFTPECRSELFHSCAVTSCVSSVDARVAGMPARKTFNVVRMQLFQGSASVTTVGPRASARRLLSSRVCFQKRQRGSATVMDSHTLPRAACMHGYCPSSHPAKFGESCSLYRDTPRLQNLHATCACGCSWQAPPAAACSTISLASSFSRLGACCASHLSSQRT